MGLTAGDSEGHVEGVRERAVPCEDTCNRSARPGRKRCGEKGMEDTKVFSIRMKKRSKAM